MAIMTHDKFHFNWLMLTLIFGIWASEPLPGPGERLKRSGLIGLNSQPCFEMLQTGRCRTCNNSLFFFSGNNVITVS